MGMAAGAGPEKWLRIAGLAVCLPILLWLCGWLAVGDDVTWVRWGAFGAPWLAFAALIAAGLLVAGRSYWRSVCAALLAILILTPALPRLNPLRWLANGEPGGLRVMTFNTSAMNQDLPAIAAVIADRRPDILFLQQIAGSDALRRAIRAKAPDMHYAAYPEGGTDTVILSRFPLSDGRLEPGMASASVTVGTCRLRLWNLHAPHGQHEIEGQALFFMHAAEAVRSAGPYVIAGGDLNSTEFNTVQAPLRAELTDAFAAAGSGLGFTFPSPVRRLGALGRLFRIDHVFVRGLETTSARVDRRYAGSDHFPLVVTEKVPECRR